MAGMDAVKKNLTPKNIAVTVATAAIVAAAALGVRSLLKEHKEYEFQKGMGYCSWSPGGYQTASAEQSLKKMAKTGTDHVAILVTWYQTNCWSGDIKRVATTPTDTAVISAIRKAHELGMKVMLKPHLDVQDKSDGSWRGEIGCIREPDWEKWFASYGAFLKHYAEIAEQEKVELFCIGTELSTAATTKGYMWRDMIKDLRGVYSGMMTYAAHWDRYMDIRFWDALDYIGINAYFPLTKKLVPTAAELKEGWKPWVEEMEAFQAKMKQPIIFPEIGCNSADGAAIRPWEHSPRSEVNLKLQADYYKVLMEIFFKKDWFYGQYWWYWGTNPNMGGQYNRSFIPQNKPAEKIVTEEYAKDIKRDGNF